MELALLPDLVLIKILKLLQSNLEDVNNLKNVNTTFRKIVTDNFHLLYYEHLCIDNKAINFSIKLGRPILKLTMTCYAEALTMPKYNIDPGRFCQAPSIKQCFIKAPFILPHQCGSSEHISYGADQSSFFSDCLAREHTSKVK